MMCKAFYSGNCAGEGQTRWLKPLSSKNFGVLVILNAAINLASRVSYTELTFAKNAIDRNIREAR